MPIYTPGKLVMARNTVSPVTAYLQSLGIVTDGMVLNLDAGTPLSYPGSGTTWTDLSGNGRNGTLTNGPTYNSANGGSIVFDGSNDYISFNNVTTSSLGLTSSSGATLSCWLKITLKNVWTGVFTFWSTSNLVDFGWDINTDNVLRLWKNQYNNNTISLTSIIFPIIVSSVITTTLETPLLLIVMLAFALTTTLLLPLTI